ncbi:MAG: glycosyltransferase family 1 protein [Anaerolineae bacterium]|nr:glycosyltransferase family 4 protein [Candidatus Roseilinea sp.]MDW8448597.1 glycosyltransferase family 1 protein [Anaerolineae bacterium]
MWIGIDASRATGARLTGTERYSREIVAALLRIAPQHCFRLYLRQVLDPDFLLSPCRSNGVEPVVIPRRRLWTHLGLARELAARPPDALFVPAHVLPVSFIRAQVQRRIRTVVTVHDVGYRRFPDAHPSVQRLYLDLGTRLSVRRADVVIADSEATRRDVLHFYGIAHDRVVVAHPGPLPLVEVQEDEARRTLAKFGLGDGRPYVLHVGTLQPRKNLRRLIQAWARVIARPDLAGMRLVLAGGPGWGSEDLRAEVEATGLQSSVVLTGYVSDTEKAALMRSARAYVFPSLYEGFGFPVLEAQAAGIPVACSNVSSLPEVAGDAALLFDPLDVEAIARALETIVLDEGVRARLVAAGYRNLTRFSWEACARIVLEGLEGAGRGT